MINITGTVDKIRQKLFLLDPNKKYDIAIKEHRQKRSLNANSYCWKLCTEIADVLNSDKDSIYVLMLKRYGVSDLIPIANKVPVKDYFDYYDVESRNEKYTWYKVYKGSSKYDTKEMSILINGIVSECKELDIPTKEDLEIKQMIDDWEKYK